jgi:hypothetical protein
MSIIAHPEITSAEWRSEMMQHDVSVNYHLRDDAEIDGTIWRSPNEEKGVDGYIAMDGLTIFVKSSDAAQRLINVLSRFIPDS